MGGKSKTPKAPDPAETAAAQSALNKENALWNSSLNNVNQYTPYGSLTWSLGTNTNSAGAPQYDYDAFNASLNAYNSGQQNNGGQQWYVDQYGRVVNDVNNSGNHAQYTPLNLGGQSRGEAPKLSDYQIGGATSSNMSGIPQWTSTINLSPEQQQIFDSQNRRDIAMGTLGEDQLGRIRDSVSSPYSYEGLAGNFTAQDYATQQANSEAAFMSRLNPQFQQDEEALRSRLINQGIGQGSQAYQREMDTFNQAKNDARTQAVLSGQQYGSNAQNQALQLRNQAIDEYNTQRNAPLNEYNAFTSGAQVTNPTFSFGGNYQGAAPVDMMGLVQNKYNSQMAQANGGGGFLGGAASGAMAGASLGPWGALAGGIIGGISSSDRRLKENIKKVGIENGYNIYEFNYTDKDGLFIGVMADEIKDILPSAVSVDEEGYNMVDYDAIGVQFRRVK